MRDRTHGHWLAAATLLWLVVSLAPTSSAAAPLAAVPVLAPPFRLPFEGDPGPATWLVGQMYGNTTGAYRLGDVWYAAGQGLHFGIDLLAPCGTPVVSIGDGQVVQADWTARGAGPHNLIVRHEGQGVSVLYGHLLERPALAAGEVVTRGQRIALSGDPDGTCNSRPHLHLEIRSLDYRTAYNPVTWIQADWDALLLLGPFSDVQFERDLADPLRWVTPQDQPEVEFGGSVLNHYEHAWPASGNDTSCVVAGC
jgi:murein DD-endopeptidase MepM/ murein hydrolase activator NlpD